MFNSTKTEERICFMKPMKEMEGTKITAPTIKTSYMCAINSEKDIQEFDFMADSVGTTLSEYLMKIAEGLINYSIQ